MRSSPGASEGTKRSPQKSTQEASPSADKAKFIKVLYSKSPPFGKRQVPAPGVGARLHCEGTWELPLAGH